MNHPLYNFRLLNTEPGRFNAWALSYLNELVYTDNIEADREFLLDSIQNYDIILIALRNVIDKKLLSLATNLKCIVTPTTGLNHIDVNYAESLDIDILSLKGEVKFLDSITATAELAWGMLISLVRHINTAHQSVIDGLWSRDLFYGHELNGMTFGIVGYGRLGKIMANYARTFGMHVIAFDRLHIDTPDIDQVSLHTLASKSDVISVHLELNSSTKGILDRNFFSSIKKGSFFVNTSRGEIVDESALLQALVDRTLSGAALDVLASETSNQPGWLMNTPLYKYANEFDNLLLTPHIGGVTYESVEKTNIFIVKKLASYLNTV